ncbi:MAG: Rieske (2Fe-2S) protein [Candidatus Nanopelagicaceae bacterium]|nr:Rieske (2Fe-2S) protein [Candidatus Nanopelagicaceae bacterium]
MAIISRKDFLALVTLILVQTGLPVANAAIGPNLKPTRIGQVIIWRGKKYTVIKSGKKLIWNKGVALPSPHPSPTQTQTPTPSPVPTPEQPLHGIFQIDLAASGEVPNGETRIFYPNDPNARGKGFVITREKNALIAFDVNCTHDVCDIEMGVPHLVCNCHLSYFNRISGVVEDGPAIDPLRSYPVKEMSGRIVVSDSY